MQSLRHWDEIPKDADFDAAVAQINPGLRRDTWPRNQAEIVTPPSEFTSLAEALLERRGRHESFGAGPLPPAGPWQYALLEERRIGGVRLRASRQEIDALTTEYGILRTGGEQLRMEVGALHAEGDELRAQVKHFEAQVNAVRTELDARQNEVDAARNELDRLLQSRTFRYTAALRGLYATLRREIGLD